MIDENQTQDTYRWSGQVVVGRFFRLENERDFRRRRAECNPHRRRWLRGWMLHYSQRKTATNTIEGETRDSNPFLFLLNFLSSSLLNASILAFSGSLCVCIYITTAGRWWFRCMNVKKRKESGLRLLCAVLNFTWTIMPFILLQ